MHQHNGLWRDSIQVDGKRKFFTSKTKAGLKRKMLEYQQKEKDGDFFSVIAEEWWEYHEKTISNNTKRGYVPALNRAIEEFKNYPINTITPQNIQKFIFDFSRTNADKTVRTQLMIVNLVFKYAVQQGYCMVNPAREIQVPKNLKKKKVLPPTDEDIEKIKETFDCTFGLFIAMGIYTGLRKGELLALNYEDINDDIIHVSKSVEFIHGKPQIKPPKTESGVRDVPVVKALKPYLKKGKGLIFKGKDGLMTESEYNIKYRQYQKESNTSFSAHQLRHMYATMLYENNIPLKDAQYLLGHAQISTTMDIYSAVRNKQKEKIKKSVENIDF